MSKMLRLAEMTLTKNTNSFIDRSNREIRFIRSQIKQIRSGGLSTLFRKVRILLDWFIAFLFIPVILLVRALQPFILIRFGSLRSERIGHFATNTELYLCERDANLHNHKCFDIFYYNGKISNYQLKKMWDRTLRISHFAKWIAMVNRLLPGAEKHIIPMTSTRDIYGLFSRTSPHLSFIPNEEQLGKKELAKLEISDGNPFVCFHVRSTNYLKNMFPDCNWEYHDYRNEKVSNYLPAIKDLAKRGYFVVRIGMMGDAPLGISDPMIIDCATKDRNDFLNIFLGAKCHFYFGGVAGFNEIPVIFRRPLALVNLIPLEHTTTWNPNCLFIPKKLWLREEHRFLTFREILDSKIGRIFRSDQYEQLGIELLENTPEEITGLAIEIDERIKGTWRLTEEDEELQRRFWSFFKPNELNQIFVSHIGTEFLRQNRELLD